MTLTLHLITKVHGRLLYFRNLANFPRERSLLSWANALPQEPCAPVTMLSENSISKKDCDSRRMLGFRLPEIMSVVDSKPLGFKTLLASLYGSRLWREFLLLT